MCGIVGAASGNLSIKEVGIFEDLMIVSNLRGRQGSGIVTVMRDAKKEHHLHSIKVLGSGIQAIGSSEYNKRVREGTPTMLLGHTRWPTKGGTDINSVHPHVYEKVVGVHNGTLMRVNQEYVTANESDSSLLYKSINEDGIEEALAKSRGAYALAFVNTEEQTLNFIRNEDRPLWFAKVRWNSFGKTLFWASERGFLSLILSRSGYKTDEYEIVNLPINELWTLPIPMSGNIDFTVKTNVRSDIRAIAPWVSQHGGKSWYENTFLGEARTSKSSSVVQLPGPSPIGKETYVWRDGVLIAKEAPHKQVFLPLSSEGNEPEGTKALPALVGKAGTEGVRQDNEQRPQASQEVPNRSSSATVAQDFPGLVKQFLSQEEVEFDDDLSDLYADAARLANSLDDPPADDPFDSFDLANANYSGDTEALVETTHNHFLTYSEAQKVLDYGCAYCGNAVKMTDAVCWVDRKEFLCEDCCEDTHALIEMNNHYPNSEIVQAWKEGRLRNMPAPPESWYNIDGTFDSTKHTPH